MPEATVAKSTNDIPALAAAMQEDALQTAADRIQTGLDRDLTAIHATTATTKAEVATTKADLAVEASGDAVQARDQTLEAFTQVQTLTLKGLDTVLIVAPQFAPGGTLENTAGAPYFGTLEDAVVHVRAERIAGRLTGSIVVTGYPNADMTITAPDSLSSLRAEDIHVRDLVKDTVSLARSEALARWIGEGIFDADMLTFVEGSALVNLTF